MKHTKKTDSVNIKTQPNNMIDQLILEYEKKLNNLNKIDGLNEIYELKLQMQRNLYVEFISNLKKLKNDEKFKAINKESI